MVQSYGMEEPLFLILIIFLVLGWISCLLRAWVKIVVMKKVTVDDYLMLCSIIFYTSYAASGLYGVTHGIGSLGRGLSLEEASVGLRSWWLCETLYAPVTLCARTSVAVFLLQIAVQRVHRRIIVLMIVAFWIATVPLFFVVIFQCKPVSYFWMQPFPAVPHGTCMDGHVLFVVSVFHSAVSASCDWALGILPMVMLWKVRLNKRTKFTLSMLLSMGIFAGAALIVRIIYVRPFDVSVNFLYQTMNVANWSILEPSVCIIAGCLATLRPLFSCFGWTSKTRGSREPPARYHRTRSRTRSQAKGSRGAGCVLSPARSAVHKGYTSSSRRAHVFRGSQRTTEDEPCNEYELMVNLEKGTAVLTDPACEHEIDKSGSCTKRCACHSAGASDEANSDVGEAGRPRARPRTASNASVKSSQSGQRLSSVSTLATPPDRPQQQPHRLSQWHDPPPGQAPSSAPATTTPLAPPPPLSPSPFHILVQKSTRIEYRSSPPATATTHSLPASALVPNTSGLPQGTAADPIGGGDLSENALFHGGHTVEISGPRPKS